MAQKLTEQQAEELFIEYEKTQDIGVRNTLLENYLFVAQIVAKKFCGRGVEYDDLYQVASMALVRAIGRYEPGRGIKFTSYATPSLIGEVKNYFRDKTRMLRIPRRDSEQLALLQTVRASIEDQNPTTEQLAEKSGLSTDRVLELLETQAATFVSSLEAPPSAGEDMTFEQTLGAADDNFTKIEDRDFLRYSMERLSEQDRAIIIARFYKNYSQRQVADGLGVSQMYVSRAEKRILQKMRSYLTDDV